MINLIVNADDFGYSPGVNYGILHSFLNGIVNSATMMMNMDGTAQALIMAKQYPGLRTGVHLVLTCGNPLLSDCKTLTKKDGTFKSQGDLEGISLDELEREWSAQIERFIAAGLTPSHLDSHHHVHTREEFLPVVQSLSQKYGLPFRVNGDMPIKGVKSYTDRCLLDFYGDGIQEDYFSRLAERAEDGETVEVMVHPAFADHLLIEGSSYNLQRIKELEILCSAKLPSDIKLL
ncbi:Cellobiose phosphotransferase system YdjC-like protein [Bacillus sp. ZZV12-4809]|uniref:chitin disaccharide deacetylase n=1 Tax=Cytobacillus sp. AMY 15.2 TaxID=2939563 RepID=UPI0013580798|nr:chitin disaccharide deacetylase [Cytobacillus sp. AMY 15.2]KAF0817376.1 Cellobiose phosphotransferase system YdjC-like protein [Bacillus sp. ZZV12-4809]MCM3089823.1 chitin disaccharide deacetylase [Cytobacillus sp. AMY 15.2]